MSSVEIGLIATLTLTIVSVITSFIVLFGKIKSAVKSFIITDASGNKKINTMEIFKVVIKAVTIAEETGKAGVEKKEIAIRVIQETLTAMNIDFNVSEIGDAIESIVGIINAFIKKK